MEAIHITIGFKSLQDKKLKTYSERDTKKIVSLFYLQEKKGWRSMQKKKRFLALLLALVVALPFIQSPLTAQAAGEGSITRKITVVKGKDINDM